MKKIRMVALVAIVAVMGLLGGCIAQGATGLDLSTSQWLDVYLEETLPAYGKDFTQSAAFSYREEGGGKLVLLYASKTGIEEVRSHYLEQHAARETGRNDETALTLSMTLERGEAVVRNYYSPISQVFEIETELSDEAAAPLTEAVKGAFPAAVTQALEGTTFLEGEPRGGYIRYTYDDLDTHYRKGVPIFSQAYSWTGTREKFDRDVALLREKYQQYSHDETQNVHYFGTESGVLTATLLPSAGAGERVAVSFQATELAE